MKSEFVFVYTGQHYGRRHKVLCRFRNYLIALHVPTGDVITAPICDTEVAS